MLKNKVKTSDTAKTQFFELIFFESDQTYRTKILLCIFKQIFEPFNMLTAHNSSDTGIFRLLSEPTICSR